METGVENEGFIELSAQAIVRDLGFARRPQRILVPHTPQPSAAARALRDIQHDRHTRAPQLSRVILIVVGNSSSQQFVVSVTLTAPPHRRGCAARMRYSRRRSWRSSARNPSSAESSPPGLSTPSYRWVQSAASQVMMSSGADTARGARATESTSGPEQRHSEPGLCGNDCPGSEKIGRTNLKSDRLIAPASCEHCSVHRPATERPPSARFVVLHRAS